MLHTLSAKHLSAELLDKLPIKVNAAEDNELKVFLHTCMQGEIIDTNSSFYSLL